MTETHTNKRAAAAAAKSLLAARITLVEELGEALDAHSKAVDTAAHAQQQVQDAADTARKAFDAAKAGGWTAAELHSTGLRPPVAPRGRAATRTSARNNTTKSADAAPDDDSPTDPRDDEPVAASAA
jgi:hypothetical protein